MKKTLVFCLCLLLVVAMATAAYAANGASFSAKASATSLYRGDSVTLTVSVDCEELATSYGLMLNYDETVFELVEGSCSVDGALVSSFNDGFAFMFQNATAYSGQIGTVTLKVKDDAVFGTVTITGDAAVKNGAEEVAATGCSVSLAIDCKHSYGEWVEVETGHSRTCPVCGDAEAADHAWDDGMVVKEATCVEEGTVKYTCSDCCAVREETVSMKAHTYGAWENTDETNHKHVCTVCQDKETAAHAFAEELTAGEEAHWYACVCGAMKDEAAHAFEDATWNKDEKSHWKVCACGLKGDEAEHAWDQGKVTTEATQKNEGVKTYTCQDCGMTKTEKIAKLPAPEQEANPETGDEMTVACCLLVVVLSVCAMPVLLTASKKICR